MARIEVWAVGGGRNETRTERSHTVKDTVSHGTRKNEGCCRGTRTFYCRCLLERGFSLLRGEGLEPHKHDGGTTSSEAFAGRKQSDLD